jgi:PAS domain S-box-containing protein
LAYGIQTLRTKAERQRAEEALIEERHLHHTLMDNLPDWIYFKDRESRFTRINLALAEKFGLETPTQAVGKTDFDFMAAEHAREFHNDDAEILRTGQPIIGKEESGIWPDGHVTWVSATKMPLRDANGAIIGTFGVSRDITERKRFEEALRESEEKYRSLVSNIPDVSWTMDANQRFVFISNNMERLSGFSPDEVYEHGAHLYLSSLHPDDVSKVREAFRALFAEGRPYDVECRVRRKDGDWIWIHDRALATYEKEGIRYADGLLSDITERKWIEGTLRLTQFSVEHASDGTFWMNSQGQIVYANEAACRSLGYAREELLSLAIPNFDPLFKKETWETFWEEIKQRGSVTFETQHQTKQGRIFPVEVTANYVEFGGREYSFAFARDITERKRAEEALRKSESKLKEALLAAQMGVWEWTVETDTVTWDENLYRIAGRDPKMPAPSYWEHPQIYAPESWERLKAAVENALATGTPYELDLEMVCPDGSRRWLIGRGEPLRDASGRITHLRGTVQDITERKWAEEALRDGEERLAEAEHLAHIGSSSWDVATDTTKWSAELYRIMGRDPSGPTPTHQERASLYAPESWARLESAVQRALKTGEPYDLELEVARPDGTRRHVHARGAAVQGDDGRIVRLHGTLQDVTERKRTEEDLALFKHSIDVHYDGAYWADTNNRFIYFNDAGCKALGYEREELIGKTVFEISPEASPEGLKRLWKGLRNQGFFSMESVHRRKDGSEYPVDLVISYVQSAGKEFACGFARDITERKRAEAESADRLRFETLLADLSARFVHVPAEQIDSEIKDAQRRVCESLALDACSLWQVMPETPGFIPLTHIYRPSEGSPIPAGINAGQYLPWSTQQILAGKVIVASSLEELPVEAARDCQTFSFFGIKSVLTLALSVGGGPVVGGLAFSTRKERTWPEELVKHLRVVAELFCSALERQRAERALRESEERFRSLFENATVGIYRTTPEGRILMANKTLVRMLGYEHFDDLAARNLEVDGFEPGYPRRLFREQIEKGGEVRGMEEAWTRLDGSEIFVRESARTIRSGDGLILYYDGIVEDITERKRAEEALRLTQFSVEHASDAILWMDSEGQIVYVNGAACRALERSREELLSLSITNIEPHFSKEDWQKFWNEIKLRGSMTFETEHQTKKGRVFPVEVTANYVGFGGKEYSFAFARDISGRKQGEAEHLRLVTAIEQSAEAVVITNTAGDIEYVNPAFTRITGYSREEALGQNPRILKSGKQEASLYQQLWATILQGKTWRGEISNQRKDGSLYTLQMSIAPVRGEHGEITHFIATEEDVTARKQLEQQFTQAQKMEAIGRLAGGVAHDFNNLLTIINGYSELLLEKLGSEHAASGYLKEIKGAGDRAASLTRQLLAFSRRQVLAPQVLNLNVVIANLEKMLTRLIGEDIKLHTILGPSLAPVKADPGQIEQVLMNLAVNARDAMPSGGNLTIETSDVELDENYADSHPTVQPGPHVMLAVVDTGTGMTPETKARIFEPFFTTKEKGKGTGLGLATVYGIVKQSGGSIWVYSELGQGTVFKIYLPAVSELPVEKGHAKAEMGPAFGTETILVIEDEEGVRTLVRHALESRGYKVLETDDAEEAVALCTNHEGTIHLLMTDVVMPKMSGPAVAERVTALRPGIKVLYMSGYTDDAVVRHGILTQDMPFLQKPFSPAALRKKIREVLGG